MVSAPAAQARAGLIIMAPLSGPALGPSGLQPVGRARYRDRAGQRDLNIALFHADVPNFTLCTAWLNNVPILTTPTFAGIALFPVPHSVQGDVVPFVQAGDVVTITAAGFGAIARGTIGAGVPVIPLPFVNLGIKAMTGAPINGILPTGGLGYNIFAGLNNQTASSFVLDVLTVNLPVGTSLNVVRIPAGGGAAQPLGAMLLDAIHHARLTLGDALGNAPAPPLGSGDVIQVLAGPQVILTGTLL
jgi:hypothetical protein